MAPVNVVGFVAAVVVVGVLDDRMGVVVEELFEADVLLVAVVFVVVVDEGVVGV